MYLRQEGLCLVCRGRYPLHGKDGLAVDHDHTTGVIRGLICPACNGAIGFMRDDPQRLRSAALYLERAKRANDGASASVGGPLPGATPALLVAAPGRPPRLEDVPERLVERDRGAETQRPELAHVGQVDRLVHAPDAPGVRLELDRRLRHRQQRL
jgi:hypothetical protein